MTHQKPVPPPAGSVGESDASQPNRVNETAGDESRVKTKTRIGFPSGRDELAEHVTEQVTEPALTEEQYRMVVERANEAICITQDGLVKFVNSAGSELTGYSQEDLLSKPFAALTHPEDVAELARLYLQRIRGEYFSPGHRFRIITSGGDVKWVESFSASIPWDGRPAVLSWIRDVTRHVEAEELLRQSREELDARVQQRTNQLRDINERLLVEVRERRQAESALRESQERLRATIENTPNVAVQWYDEQGRVLFWNRASELVFGWTAEEAVGKTLDQLIQTADEAAEFMKAIGEIERTNRALGPSEYHFRRKDGTEGFSLATMFAIPSGDGGRYFVCMDVDITQRKSDREALRQSEERHRTAWETSPDALSISRLKDGVYVDVNSGYTFLTGYTRDEVLGKSALDIPFWADTTDRAPFAAALEQHGHVRNFETRLRRKDGETRSILISAGLMMLEGEPHLLAVTKDIDDFKRAVEALRESERKYRLLAENGSDVIWTMGLDLRLTYISPSAERLQGWKSGEWLSLGPSDFMTPASLALVSKVLEDELALQASPEGDPNRVRTLELEQYRKDGTTLSTEVSARFLRDDTGAIIGIIGATRDISERKRSDEQLKRLFAAVEQAGETIMITDPQGTILYVNPAFEKISGYGVPEAIGKTPGILRSDKHDRAFYQEIWESVKRGAIWRGRFTNRRKDGTLYEETATISPIKDEAGRVTNYVMVGRDVTAEIRLQKQLLHAQKMEAIGTLAGGIAHDFNNLLQAIIGYTDLLLMRKAAEDPDRKKLEVIQHAALDGADLVSRILTFSRKAESRTRPLDLNDEIRKAQKLLRRTLPRMIEIKLVLAKALHVIDADPAQIEQVLLNLAVNAQHAMPDGGQLLIETSNVSLSDALLRAHLGAKAGKYVLLTVSDTGAGMEPEVLDRIFEPFFTTKTNGEGTGLGLAMVHGLVSQHSGYIRCYSEPGRGTSFKIYLPAVVGQFVADPAFTREMPAFGSETVLLVDDDDRVRELGQELIQMGGYRVLAAGSGEEALGIYAGHREEISLVILDLIMPGMGGKRCLEELLRMDPNVRVLLASGYSSNGLALDTEEGRARGFLTKPYDAKDILAAIRKVLDRGRL